MCLYTGSVSACVCVRTNKETGRKREQETWGLLADIVLFLAHHGAGSWRRREEEMWF